MNVDELWALTKWYDAEIVGRKIPDQYAQLHTVLLANTQPSQPRQAFESIKDGLIRSIKAVNVWSLSSDQFGFLEDLNVARHIGDAGAVELDDILFRNAIDIATASNKVQAISQEIAVATDKFSKVRLGLAGIVDDVPTKLKSDEALIRVRFTGDAGIKNVVDLRTWSDSWFTIARGIAMAQGEAPEAVRVISAGTGSIIIELGMAYGMAKTTSAIILEALKVTDRVLDIRKKAAEIRAMHLSNKKIEQDLAKEAEKERSDGTDAIVLKVTSQVGLNPAEEGDKIKALNSAIKTLVEFTTKGGEVDCVLPPDETTKTSQGEAAATIRSELKVTFQEIRFLEDRQRQIGFTDTNEGSEPKSDKK